MRPLRTRVRLSAHDAMDAQRAHRRSAALLAGRLPPDLERKATQLRPGRRQRALGFAAVDCLLWSTSSSLVPAQAEYVLRACTRTLARKMSEPCHNVPSPTWGREPWGARLRNSFECGCG